MAITQDANGPLLRRVKPVKEYVDVGFRKKHGIKGKDGKYHLPLPDAGHPAAKSFARAVLRRAGQTTELSKAQIARQVAKAKRILGKSKESLVRAPQSTPLTMTESVGEIGSTWGTLREGSHSDASSMVHSIFRVAEAKLDNDKGTARVVLIREGPGNAADRHWYTSDSLRNSATLFEGAKSYLDHPTKFEEVDNPGRSVLRLAGYFEDVEFLEDYDDPLLGKVGALAATFVPQEGNQHVLGLLRTAEQYAKRNPEKAYVGFSIYALGGGAVAQMGTPPQRFNRVDQITKVYSVDIVTEAGAGGRPLPGTFRESARMTTTAKPGSDTTVVAIDSKKLREGAQGVVSTVQTATFDALMENLGDLPAEVKAKFIAARKKLEESEIDDATIDALTEAVEEAMEDDGDDPEETTEGGPGKGAEIGESAKTIASLQAKLAEANKTNGKLTERLDRNATADRTRNADRIMEELKVPENHRPFLRGVMLEGAKDAKAMQATASNYLGTLGESASGQPGGGNLREGGRTAGKIAVPASFADARR